MSVYTINWCRVEGATVNNIGDKYGTLSNLYNHNIFYGSPEIQIFNKQSLINGCIYKVVPISEFNCCGNCSIKEIDNNYTALQNKINSYNKTIDTDNGCIFFYEPFTVSESCVIFHGDSTLKEFTYASLILVDGNHIPEIIAITGVYTGNAIPVGNTYEEKLLEMYTVYEDGNKARLIDGYTVADPSDKIVTKVGINNFKIQYVTPSGNTLTTTVVIQGTRNLTGISAIYDGPVVGYTQEAQRKYFVVVAEYSDGSSDIVTDFSFPNGNIVTETNKGLICVYYKGYYFYVNVPTFTISSANIMAYYNGPNVEVGHDFEEKYCKVKIYYKASNNTDSFYEDIDPSDCEFLPMTIDHEGVNQITVAYNSKAGYITTHMAVIGVKPDIVLNCIQATYTGPEIVVGKSFSAERVICKAYYSNGAVVQIKNFSINSNVVTAVGFNEYTVTYKEKDITKVTKINVIGVEKESTTKSGYMPISLLNFFPEATKSNNRYRGPAESRKLDNLNRMIKENITVLYAVFANLEFHFNELIDAANGSNSIKVKTLNEIEHIETTQNQWMKDKRFTMGKYIKEVNNEQQ